MRTILIVFWAAASLAAQTGKLGLFTNSGDVGEPAIKGSTAYDEAKGEYRLTGAGANIWAKADQFQYVWREMTGDFAVTATVQFVGQGAIEHRKAGIMLRKGLDTDSPYVDLMLHGNGMPAFQWRNTKGDITNGIDLPFDGPAKFKLRLVRRGGIVVASLGKAGQELRELGHTQVQLGNPVNVGLAVSSHKPDTAETAIFSDVTVEVLPSAATKKKQ